MPVFSNSPEKGIGILYFTGPTMGYLIGFLVGVLIGWDKPIFKLGFQPFLLAEIFKLALLTILYPQIKKINKFI